MQSRHRPLVPFASCVVRCLRRGVGRAVLAPVVLLGACGTNPFLENYAGERMPSVAAATVVSEPPPVDTVRQLGGSTFQSSNGQTGDAQATAAAMQVGADLVMWSRQPLDREQWVENDPVYERRASGRGQFSSYIPLPGSRERWTYAATFWRSLNVPAAPVAAPKAPEPATAPGASSAPGPR